MAAVQGYINASFFKCGLQRLLRNYVRPYKAKKVPGPGYYRIPFHKELLILLFLLVQLNPNLFTQMLINQGRDETDKSKDPFAVTLAKFLLVKLHELRQKILGKDDKCSTFDKNMLMILSYTFFSISGTQPRFIEVLSSI